MWQHALKNMFNKNVSFVEGGGREFKGKILFANLVNIFVIIFALKEKKSFKTYNNPANINLK